MDTLDHLNIAITLPGRYAVTLLDLADESNDIAAISDSFKTFMTCIESSPALRTILKNSDYSKDSQLAVITEIAEKLGCHKLFMQFLKLLSDNRRLDKIEEIYHAFDELVDRHNDTQRFTVSYAQELTQTQQTTLKDLLMKHWGNNVHIEYIKDPNILAGFVVSTGNQVIDLSITTQLHRLASAMKGHA